MRTAVLMLVAGLGTALVVNYLTSSPVVAVFAAAAGAWGAYYSQTRARI
jgi:hypothetical protein